MLICPGSIQSEADWGKRSTSKPGPLSLPYWETHMPLTKRIALGHPLVCNSVQRCPKQVYSLFSSNNMRKEVAVWASCKATQQDPPRCLCRAVEHNPFCDTKSVHSHDYLIALKTFREKTLFRTHVSVGTSTGATFPAKGCNLLAASIETATYSACKSEMARNSSSNTHFLS